MGRRKRSSLSMIDQSIILGGGTAMAGVVAGVGLVAFAESMGDRSAERGIGLSDNMSTKITGGLMEDVEVDSVEDLSSLTDKLEAALMKSGGADQEALQLSDDDKKRIADDGMKNHEDYGLWTRERKVSDYGMETKDDGMKHYGKKARDYQVWSRGRPVGRRS